MLVIDRGAEKFAQKDGLGFAVWQLDAYHVASEHDGDAHRNPRARSPTGERFFRVPPRPPPRTWLAAVLPKVQARAATVARSVRGRVSAGAPDRHASPVVAAWPWVR